MTTQDAYKRGFEDGLKAAAMRTKAEAKWISEKVDDRHYHYLCSHCLCVSKYKKSNFCPDCGKRMEVNR